MLRRRLFCQLLILALWMMSLPVSKAQTIPTRGHNVPISCYTDDPYVWESDVRHLQLTRFGQASDGRLTLLGHPVWVQDEAVIYRENRESGEFTPFAWNPWPETRANENGDFRFSNEERFPLFNPERGTDGKIVMREGLQVWTLNQLNLGLTTAFAAAGAVKDAAEGWAGRNIPWGQEDGRLSINAHSFIDFNAFYAPGARQLFFGVMPYRLPGQTEVKMFETATSWEMVGHECGHALHHALKPNSDVSHQGWRTWSESFADQMAMWASLRQPERVSRLLAETTGNFNQSNSLSSLVEAFAVLINEGTGIRDAFHDKKVSDTDEEIHARSEVLTGATYKLFLTIYDGLRRGHGNEEALRQTGQIMGFFLLRAADYMPENQVTLEDVAKAYLKVDKEFFGSRYHAALVDEFTRRELFDVHSEREWQAHEAALPPFWLHPQWADERIELALQTNLDKLGLGPAFGLKLQSVTRLHPTKQFGPVLPMRGPAQTIVRVQLTQGRGPTAQLLDNHGILVFRANGNLSDYHMPLLPAGQAAWLPDVFVQTQALNLLGEAARLRLDDHGVPLALVRQPNGQWTVEAHVLRGEGLNTWMEVFTPNNLRGERREVVLPPVPPSQRLRSTNDLLK